MAPDARVSRRRAAWNYVWLFVFNTVLFAGAGFGYAMVSRPLVESAWGGWLAHRVNRGKEAL